jgi:hypothetical protein
MYSEAKHKGDHDSVGEELLIDIPELEERAKVVEKAVKEGYFTLEEALSLYKVSEIEYLAYALLKNKNKLGKVAKHLQAMAAISMMTQVFHEVNYTFDPKVKTIMHQFEVILKQNPAIKKLKIKA